MSKKGSWYFEGYRRVESVRPNGKMGSHLEYVGEWYGLGQEPAETRRLKLQLLALAVVGYAIYFYAQLTPASGGMTSWVGGPSLLILIPMMWHIMGLFNFLPSKEKWEIRVYYSGYRRLERCVLGTLVMMCLWGVLELVYIVLNLGNILEELPCLLKIAVAAACFAGQRMLIRKHPAVIVEKQPDDRS